MKKLLFIFLIPLIIIFAVEVFACLSYASPGMMGGTYAGLSIPTAPTLTPTAGNAQVSLAYTNTAGTSQNGYYSTSSGSCASKTQVTGVANPWVFSGTNGTPYYFQGTNVNSAGESTCSSEVNATPYVEPPVQQGGYSGILTGNTVGTTVMRPLVLENINVQHHSITHPQSTMAKIQNYYACTKVSENLQPPGYRFKIWKIKWWDINPYRNVTSISQCNTMAGTAATYTFTGIICQTGDLTRHSTTNAVVQGFSLLLVS